MATCPHRSLFKNLIHLATNHFIHLHTVWKQCMDLFLGTYHFKFNTDIVSKCKYAVIKLIDSLNFY